MANFPLPSNVGYGFITARIQLAVGDTPDDQDSFPDGAPAVGTITFTPSVTSMVNANAFPSPTVIVPKPIVCTLDNEGYLIGPDGNRGVWLVSSTDPDNNPHNWTYAVTFSIRDVSLPGFNISVPETGIESPLDLALMLPTVASEGEGLPQAQAAAAAAAGAALQAQAAAADAAASLAAGIPGPRGPAGPIGPTSTVPGPRGPAGIGIPAGGTKDQVLIKNGSVSFDTHWRTLDKEDVGLDKVDNTADINKPVSVAQQNALDERATWQMALPDGGIVGDTVIKRGPEHGDAGWGPPSPPGQITQYAGLTAPLGWLLCRGESVARTAYPALFAAIGTRFGSANGTTFNLPNLAGRVPVGQSSSDTQFDVVGETGGAKTHTLTEAEMPSHTHVQDPHTHNQHAHAHGQNVTATNAQGSGVRRDYASDGPSAAYTQGIETASTTARNMSSTARNQETGGGEAHNNLQPYIVLNYIIKT